MTNEEKSERVIRALVRKAGGTVTLSPEELELSSVTGTFTITNSINGDWVLKVEDK